MDTTGAVFDGVITFEQDPNQILDALLPLYMNSQVSGHKFLRSQFLFRRSQFGSACEAWRRLRDCSSDDVPSPFSRHRFCGLCRSPSRRSLLRA